MKTSKSLLDEWFWAHRELEERVGPIAHFVSLGTFLAVLLLRWTR
jgi:hypothetical protein